MTNKARPHIHRERKFVLFGEFVNEQQSCSGIWDQVFGLVDWFAARCISATSRVSGLRSLTRKSLNFSQVPPRSHQLEVKFLASYRPIPDVVHSAIEHRRLSRESRHIPRVGGVKQRGRSKGAGGPSDVQIVGVVPPPDVAFPCTKKVNTLEFLEISLWVLAWLVAERRILSDRTVTRNLGLWNP